MTTAAKARLALAGLVASVLLVGCQLLDTGSPWGDPPHERSAAGDDYGCADCHDEVVAAYDAGPHGEVHIACGQCHRGSGHPEFSEPLDDRTCGGCHLPEYQQVELSAHARRGTREGGNREAAPARFVVVIDGASYFSAAGDAASRHLCAACHFDEHRLSANRARQPGFCTSCHAGLGNHPRAAAAPAVDCIDCHMRRGATAGGQIVTSHTFATPENRSP